MTFMKLTEYQIKVYDNYDVKRQEKNNSVVKKSIIHIRLELHERSRT